MKHVDIIIHENFKDKIILNHKENEDCRLKLSTFTKVFWCRREDLEKYGDYTSKDILQKIEKKTDSFPSRFKTVSLYLVPKSIQDYCIKDKFKEKGLFIHGQSGTGKTYAAYAMARTFIANDYQVLIKNYSDLLQEIKDEFNMTPDHNYIPVQKRISEFEGILFLDDMGAENTTNWSIEKLYNIINYRYENMLTTIITSNFAPRELKDVVGDRIVSRLVEMCCITKLEGKDKRLDTVQVFKD